MDVDVSNCGSLVIAEDSSSSSDSDSDGPPSRRRWRNRRSGVPMSSSAKLSHLQRGLYSHRRYGDYIHDVKHGGYFKDLSARGRRIRAERGIGPDGLPAATAGLASESDSKGASRSRSCGVGGGLGGSETPATPKKRYRMLVTDASMFALASSANPIVRLCLRRTGVSDEGMVPVLQAKVRHGVDSDCFG